MKTFVILAAIIGIILLSLGFPVLLVFALQALGAPIPLNFYTWLASAFLIIVFGRNWDRTQD